VTEVHVSESDAVITRAREFMEANDLDAIVAMSPENVAYVAGVTPPSQRLVRARHAACVVPLAGESTFVAVKLEGPVVRARSRLDEIVLYEEFVEDPMNVVARVVADVGLDRSRIGIEETFLPVADHRKLQAALPRAELVAVDGPLATLRMVKTPREIATIRAIAGAAERIHAEVAARFGAGATEAEVGRFIAERYGEEGGDGLTMLVVGSGERSAFLNAPPTPRVLERGDLVRIDIIGTKDAYYSDVARTLAVGEPSDEQRRIFALLYDVHRAVIDAVRPGVLSSDIYAIYHERMVEAGLPPYHFVGHGLGVTLHEEPFIDAIHSIPLAEGMVLCIEPLTALDGRFGVQIEDEVLVTADGCELLTEAGAEFPRAAGGR